MLGYAQATVILQKTFSQTFSLKKFGATGATFTNKDKNELLKKFAATGATFTNKDKHELFQCKTIDCSYSSMPSIDNLLGPVSI